MWRIKECELQIWSWSSPVQPENATLFTISFQCLKKKDFQKLAGLWLAGEVVNHIGIYGSKAAEGLSAFQRRSCVIILSTLEGYCWLSYYASFDKLTVVSLAVTKWYIYVWIQMGLFICLYVLLMCMYVHFLQIRYQSINKVCQIDVVISSYSQKCHSNSRTG